MLQHAQSQCPAAPQHLVSHTAKQCSRKWCTMRVPHCEGPFGTPLRNPTECAVHSPWIPTLRHWHSLADCACNTYADAVATVSAAALQLQPPCTCAYASLAVAGKYNLLPPTPGTFPQPQMETFVPESNIHTKQGPALGVEARPVATHRSRAPSTTGCATWSNCPCNKACTYLLCCHSIVTNLGDLPAGGNPKQSHRSETPLGQGKARCMVPHCSHRSITTQTHFCAGWVCAWFMQQSPSHSWAAGGLPAGSQQQRQQADTAVKLSSSLPPASTSMHHPTLVLSLCHGTCTALRRQLCQPVAWEDVRLYRRSDQCGGAGMVQQCAATCVQTCMTTQLQTCYCKLFALGMA